MAFPQMRLRRGGLDFGILYESLPVAATPTFGTVRGCGAEGERGEGTGRFHSAADFQSGIDAALCHRTPKKRRRLWCGGKRSATPLCSTPTVEGSGGTAEARSREGCFFFGADSKGTGRFHFAPGFESGIDAALCHRTPKKRRRLWSAAGSGAPRRFAQRQPWKGAEELQRRGVVRGVSSLVPI